MKLYFEDKNLNEASFSDFIRSKQDPEYLSETRDLVNHIQSYLDKYDSNYSEQKLRRALDELKAKLN